MKYFYIFLIFLFACSRPSGPCEYDITEVQAKVIAIEPYTDDEYKKNNLLKTDTAQLFHIILRFNMSSLREEKQKLEDLVPRVKHKTDAEFINRNKIRVDDIYTGTVSEIKSGNCQPVFLSFNHYFKTE